MTEQECIKWVQENLPFAMKSKKGKLQYPFKAAYYAREIEQCLGKSLYKLLAEQNGYEREFVEWLIKDQEIFFGELTEGYLINDNPKVKDKTSLDELHEYWNKEIKSTKANESVK